ncbi:MAG: zinc-dependent alcohol dehydrogenase [Anaerolineae bacterium]
MKAIVNIGCSQLVMQELPTPEPAANQVRIRTATCGISSTDLKALAQCPSKGFPRIPGHQWAGVVDAVGPGGDGALIGCRVVGSNVLSDGGRIGFEHPGGYGQYLLMERASVYRLPESVDLGVATLVGPLAVCLRALNRLQLRDTDNALIFGDGPRGLLMLMLLRARGVARVAIIGGRDARLEMAPGLGASLALDFHELGLPLGEKVRQRLGQFQTVIETSGAPVAVAAALEVVEHRGQVLVQGDYGESRADFAWDDFLHRELSIVGNSTVVGALSEAVQTVAAGDLPLTRLVTHRFPADEFAEAMALIRAERDDVKVVLDWSEA